jgi:TRAP transporter 4TM/12TM fusion protein
MGETPVSANEKPRSSKYRSPGRFWNLILLLFTAAGLVLAISQIFLIEPILENAYFYWLLALFLSPVYLFFPARRGRDARVPFYDLVFFFLTLGFSSYLAYHAWDITHEGWAFLAPFQVNILSLALCLLILEAVRRAGGTTLFIFTGVFAAYPIFASAMPGVLEGNELPFWNVARYHILSTESVIGIPIQVVATLIIGFMVFGEALTVSGGGKFFLDFAFALLGSKQGGPAKVSIVSSGLFGTLSGSVISNIITTGSATIPTMKRSGYPPYYAAAVEACASTGGCIMPPVMGAVAFVMASFLGVAYVEVAKAAAIPAILYYLGLFFQVDFFARKVNLPGLPRDELPDLLPVLKNGLLYLSALLLLVYLLFLRREAQAPFYASLALLGIAMLRKSTRLYFRDYVSFLRNVGLVLSELVAILAACGFIIGAFSVTGVGASFAREIVQLAGENAPLMLLFGALGSFILGMGMTVTACYIFLAIILAPALAKVGSFSAMGIHLFVLYWGVVSFITPPVALGSYTAAGIAGANFMRTGYTSMRLGFVTYIIPFFFIYSPPLIMQGDALQILYRSLTAVAGIFLLAAGFEGYLVKVGRLGWIERTLVCLLGFLVAMPHLLSDMIAAVVALGVGVLLFLRKKSRDKPGARGEQSSF